MEQELNMLVSGIIERNGEKAVCVYFSDKERFAEGYVPECKVTSQKGFSDEEIADLETYLDANKEKILNEAKLVNPLKAILKD